MGRKKRDEKKKKKKKKEFEAQTTSVGHALPVFFRSNDGCMEAIEVVGFRRERHHQRPVALRGAVAMLRTKKGKVG